MNAVHYYSLIVLASAALLAEPALTQNADDNQVKTVLGPRNPSLVDGANALLAGDAEEGIRLTRLGLDVAVGQRERQAGLGNICAGYVLLDRYDEALEYCNQALAEYDRNWRALCNRALIYIKKGRFEEAARDLERGEEIAPNARALKEVRGMYLDATDPVNANITIDDRRKTENDDET